jgi:hypothetical protein
VDDVLNVMIAQKKEAQEVLDMALQRQMMQQWSRFGLQFISILLGQ